MAKLLEETVEELRTLPEDEQDRAARALLAFARGRADYSFDHEEIAGIHHAMQQADCGEFASDAVVRGIFGRYEGARHGRHGISDFSFGSLAEEPLSFRRTWQGPSCRRYVLSRWCDPNARFETHVLAVYG